MRLTLFFSVLAVLWVLDVSTTWHLIANSEGRELNPYVDASSLSSLALSPMPILSAIFFSICAIAAERRKEFFEFYWRKKSIHLFYFVSPMYYILMLLMAVINNASGVAGFGTPVSYLTDQLDNLFQDAFIGIWVTYSVFIMLTSPLALFLAQRIYVRRNAR